jgi:hypothetical protein
MTTESKTIPSRGHYFQVDHSTKIKPHIVSQLNDWQYVERSIHRLLAAWGRHFGDWDNKSICHRHVWEQAEVVRQLRERIEEFPGGNPEMPVSDKLEKLVDTVLLAPSFNDALDGIFQLLNKTLAASYVAYVQNAHPAHDAPTVRTLHSITGIKEGEWLWYRDWRRSNPHQIDVSYKTRVEEAIKECGYLMQPLPRTEEAARPCGVNVHFLLPRFSNRPPGSWKATHNIMPLMREHYTTDIHTRRLFWAYAYMLEKHIPDDQLRWIWYSHYMPWEFHHDVSRHLWDESRHGDSGYSRLKDFGISLEEIGFSNYGIDPTSNEWDPADPDDHMDPKKLYESLFYIGMVAETGHFEVKNEAFADFRNSEDMESAEMMLFDIIDETAHVQYAHKWLPVLAEKAELDNTGYKERSVRERKRLQQELVERMHKEKAFATDTTTNDYAFYQDCLRRIRKSATVKEPVAALRSHLPM